jgi:hypothetical protein
MQAYRLPPTEWNASPVLTRTKTLEERCAVSALQFLLDSHLLEAGIDGVTGLKHPLPLDWREKAYTGMKVRTSEGQGTLYRGAVDGYNIFKLLKTSEHPEATVSDVRRLTAVALSEKLPVDYQVAQFSYPKIARILGYKSHTILVDAQRKIGAKVRQAIDTMNASLSSASNN